MSYTVREEGLGKYDREHYSLTSWYNMNQEGWNAVKFKESINQSVWNAIDQLNIFFVGVVFFNVV